ncbi:hypothetical protein [Kitasatospora sp. NPDC088351]|uniref:hypothetical protein n=1 Tax=unclassified Kitasatospora TaxID=2633591 RepID=UPI003438F9B6
MLAQARLAVQPYQPDRLRLEVQDRVTGYLGQFVRRDLTVPKPRLCAQGYWRP